MPRPITFISINPANFSVIISNESELIASCYLLSRRLNAKFHESVIWSSCPKSYSFIDRAKYQVRTAAMKAFIDCTRLNGEWAMAVGQCNPYSNERLGCIYAKDLQWFLSSKYTLLDGTTVDSKEEVDEWLKEFTLKEFTEFLNKNNIFGQFLKNLTSTDKHVNGWCSKGKVLDTENPLATYLSTKIWGWDNIFMRHVGYAITSTPFDWPYTNEGFCFWSSVHSKWARHVAALMRGEKAKMT